MNGRPFTHCPQIGRIFGIAAHDSDDFVLIHFSKRRQTERIADLYAIVADDPEHVLNASQVVHVGIVFLDLSANFPITYRLHAAGSDKRLKARTVAI